MQRDTDDGVTVTSPHFRSRTYTGLSSETFSDHDLNEAFQKMHASMEQFLREGSGWYISRVIKLEIHTVIYAPVRASSYLPLPKTLAKNNGILNIQNTDEKCFLWCVLASLHATDHRPTEVDHYIRFENELNMTHIAYPVQLSNIDKFENQNTNISVNVFGFDNNEIIPLKITRHSGRIHHVNVLLIKCGKISHYCLIKDLNGFLSRSKSHNGKHFFCCYCLHGFRRENLLNKHQVYCSMNEPQNVLLPTDNDDILQFKDFEN